MDEPLLVEIIAYTPTVFYHCTHCEFVWREMDASRPIHQEQLVSSLPDDLIQEYQKISDWAEELFRRFNDQITLKIIDAASVQGLAKSLRYGLHRFPAVVVDRQDRFNEQSLDRASEDVARRLVRPQPAND